MQIDELKHQEIMQDGKFNHGLHIIQSKSSNSKPLDQKSGNYSP